LLQAFNPFESSLTAIETFGLATDAPQLVPTTSEVVTAGADIEEWMEKSGVVSPTVEYSITSFGLTHPPMIHLVSAWVLGNSEKAEPLVRGTGTIARTAVGYP